MLNRLLVIETGKRLKDHSPKLASQVLLAPLEAGLKDILNRAGPLVFGQLQHSDRAPPVHRVPWGLGAERMFGELVEEVHRLCDTAMAGAGASHLIGPAQFISRPTVINFLVRAPLSVCAMDEFGSFLKRINSRKASGFEGAISGVLRTTWGSSFKPMPTPELAPKGAGKDHALQQLLGDVMAQAFFAPRRDGRSDRYDLAIGCDPRDADRVIGQLRGGLISQPEAFLLTITTQSERPPSGVFRSELHKAGAVRDGRLAAPLCPILYEMPEGTDWKDSANWRMVTPNAGKSITVERLLPDFEAAGDASGSGHRRPCRRSGAWAGQRPAAEAAPS